MVRHVRAGAGWRATSDKALARKGYNFLYGKCVISRYINKLYKLGYCETRFNAIHLNDNSMVNSQLKPRGKWELNCGLTCNRKVASSIPGST